MKILIIEDDSNKLAQISDFLNDYFKDKELSCEFIVKQSFQSGLSEIFSSCYKVSAG